MMLIWAIFLLVLPASLPFAVCSPSFVHPPPPPFLFLLFSHPSLISVVDVEERRKSTGDTPHSAPPVTSPVSAGPAAGFVPGPAAGSTVSLDRVQARVGRFNPPVPGQKPAPPPTKTKPGKMQMSNFQQLEGLVGRGSGKPMMRPPMHQQQ